MNAPGSTEAATVIFDDVGLVCSVQIADWALDRRGLDEVVWSVLGQLLTRGETVVPAAVGETRSHRLQP